MPTISEQGFIGEDKLIQTIVDLDSYIVDSDLIIFYTKSSVGLQAFVRYFQQSSPEKQEMISKKYLVHISDSSIDVARNFTYQAFQVIQPDYVLLTRPEALAPLFSEKDFSSLPDILYNRGIEFRLVNETDKNLLFGWYHWCLVGFCLVVWNRILFI